MKTKVPYSHHSITLINADNVEMPAWLWLEPGTPAKEAVRELAGERSVWVNICIPGKGTVPTYLSQVEAFNLVNGVLTCMGVEGRFVPDGTLVMKEVTP